MQQVAYIDHYDSFTANLIDWLLDDARSLTLEVTAFDDNEKMAWLARKHLPLVFSPGPKSPFEARSSVQLMEDQLGKVPILGVCLGHQMLGVALGGSIERSRHPYHGEGRLIRVVNDSGFLKDLPKVFHAGVYHSLVVNPAQISPLANVTAVDEYGECQVLEYRPERGRPALGVQFHPESFLTDDVAALRKRWLDEVFS